MRGRADGCIKRLNSQRSGEDGDGDGGGVDCCWLGHQKSQAQSKSRASRPNKKVTQ